MALLKKGKKQLYSCKINGHYEKNLFHLPYLKNNLRDQYLVASLRANTPAHELVSNGIYIQENFLSDSEVETMLINIPNYNEMRRSPEGTETRFVVNADSIDSLEIFFKDEFIKSVIQAAIGSSAHMLRAVAQRRRVKGWTGAFEQFFHSDSWRYRYKAFLYLTDVSADNAPLVYAPKTARGAWRYLLDREINRTYHVAPDTFLDGEDSQFVGTLLPHQSNRVFKKVNTKPITVCAPRGTLIIFDARGLHKVKPLEQGERIILSSYWVEKGKHV